VQHPLLTTKRHDFEAFAKCLRLIDAGAHLETAGLIEIARITETMNHRKSRQEMIRILRDHTPNTPRG
jgi:hypothetical protein